MLEILAGSGMYPFYTVATYDGCVTGYALVGDPISRCTGDGMSVNGVFEGVLPTCQGVCVCMCLCEGMGACIPVCV